MRILAIDHGSKRMGIAVSDELLMIAQPLEFIPAEPWTKFLDRLNQLLQEKEAALILVGLPRNMDGSYGPSAEKVREFITKLKETISLPIKTWDERWSSTQANRALKESGLKGKKQRSKVDQTAAAIFLQSYLDAGGGLP